MANCTSRWQPTSRDYEILAVLEILPLTSEQLFKWSGRFDRPFAQIDDVRRRLRKLYAAGLVRRWPLAIESRGSTPHYYKLTPEGYRFLKRDESARPERKRAFAPIGRALHYHAQALADFIVHAGVAAERVGIEFTHLCPENSYRVVVGEETLLLDWRFTLVSASVRRTYNVELDNSTETILTPRDRDSIGRKIRLLDADDAQFHCLDPRRALTLFVTTRSRLRLEHILAAAAALVHNPRRSLIYGVYLPDFLAENEPLTSACFLDHRARTAALFPRGRPAHATSSVPTLATAAPVC